MSPCVPSKIERTDSHLSLSSSINSFAEASIRQYYPLCSTHFILKLTVYVHAISMPADSVVNLKYVQRLKIKEEEKGNRDRLS